MFRPPDFTFFVDRKDKEVVAFLLDLLIAGKSASWTFYVLDAEQHGNGVTFMVRFTGRPETK